MTGQSDVYKRLTNVASVQHIVGADGPRDALRVALAFQDLDLAVKQADRSRDITDWSAGPLDVSATTVPTEQQTPVGVEDSTGTQVDPLAAGDQPLDVSGATVPVEARNDWAAEQGTSVAAGGSTSKALAAQGAEDIRLRVSRATTSYDVYVDWEDSAGNVIWTESVATGVAGGAETLQTIPASTPYATVRVADAGSSSGAVTATYNMR
jgi:hypothetical protein